MVRLKGTQAVGMGLQAANFNSTMVRLKALQRWKEVAQAAFQFHYGTIKRNSGKVLSDYPQYFNSTMVRLKVQRIYAKEVSRNISIPLWYD